MFQLTRQVRFGLAPGVPEKAGSPNGHGGHPPLCGVGVYLALEVTVVGDLEPETGYLRNIKEIDAAVRERAIPLISEALNASASSAAQPGVLLPRLHACLADAWPGVRLQRLELHLSPTLSAATLTEELPMIRLSQKFEFSASHRLHNSALSDEENRRAFGKCNNPHGHGHNYELQVTLAGVPNDRGVLIDIPAFEQVVDEAVIRRFDHRNLNVELPEFQSLNPSVENIARVIFGLLKPRFAALRVKLASVTVWETPRTWCEYSDAS